VTDLDGGASDADHAAAVRTLRLFVAALVLVAIAGVAIVLSGTLEAEEPAADDPTVLDGAGAEVGPPAGTPIDDYLALRRADLAAAEGRRVAVVSLVSYRTDIAVEDLLDAVGGLDLAARLVALPGGEPEAIDRSTSSWVIESRTAIRAERDEIAALLPTIEDPEDPFIATYTEDLARLDAQLAGLDPAGELLFGAVVVGDAGALRRLAERPEVRLLDVAPGDVVGDLTAYVGLRPEERDLAGTPPTRPT